MEFETFEWHERKRLKNLKKHKIDFEDVFQFFNNPILVKRSDRNGEERYLAVGLLNDYHITVVYTIRGGRCRFISARKARDNEREAYCKAFAERASQGKD
jgi:hypothetical protein